MEFNKEDIRICLRYEYILGRTVPEAIQNICTVYGQGAISRSTAYEWYDYFRNNDFSIKDKDRPGRPVEIDLDALKRHIADDPKMSTRCLSSMLGCTHTAILYHLKQLGFVLKIGSWVPHDLSLDQLKKRVEVCEKLLNFRRNFNWLDNLITGDEKWVLYVNHTRKHQWLKPEQDAQPTPKPDLHPKKVMLCVWWDVYGVVYWELLPSNTTITAKVYCNQIQKMRAEYQKKRPKTGKKYFLHDNARPHIAKVTKEKLKGLDWEVLPHPPYSPDLAPTDYHLFLSLSNSLRDKKFDNQEALEEFISTFFSSKSPEFYRSGIHSLAKRWQAVVLNNGKYITKK